MASTVEQAWERHVQAGVAHEEAWANLDAMISDKTTDGIKKGVSAEDYAKALQVVEQTMRVNFNTFDAWQYAVKHEHDAVLVAEDDLRAVVKDTIQGNLDGVEFKVNYGILSSKVAQSIREYVTEDDTLEAVFCGNC